MKKNDVVLITGCGGMLGEAVYSQFKDVCKVFATDIDLNESWLEHLDVTDHNEVKILTEKIKPDYILHLAALTDMEYCELNPKESYTVNAGGVENLAWYAHSNNIPFLYISTAGIFDGKKDVYNELDKPNPQSIYARSKYVGELVAKSLSKSIVLRAGWMVGGGPKKDKKFVNKVIKQIQNGCKELFVVDDKLGTPCYTYDLAKSMFYLLNEEKTGIFHGACEGSGSRYDVAEFLLEKLGLKNKIKLTKVDSFYFKKEFFAPRPYSEKLTNIKLKELNSELTRDWKQCLGEYLEKFDWKV
ncbi:MAG: NAD(P)-dependent oxidoreductase [Candidatus Buchananbacteria bacterium CG10_big_fil_rev_8_21_14_0_10_33_19]|uniref:dTDP-4-dehydrorhamnose reductase n=1 Tax=Candidatus Buchananbacteria bacterium CG10_big_fil_rev_8_21_14_0_10_33_19 TaxID=1974525 RepID=A0A2H0W434_9BACT|nr:MAG: NAD(P)-dependent oxidoreductase [Candidatus Buchananbacteria bacterium CG10_big_fil_rev_8_21_14_0_10_33_19]